MRKLNTAFSPVDSKTKEAFAKVCREAGLSPRQVLTLFTESVVEQGDLPFNIKAKQLEMCMYGDAPAQISVDKEVKVDPKEMFIMETENRFFNELMGI